MDEKLQREVFSSNLKERIRISGKSQKDIAKDLNVPYTTLNTWCKGTSMPSVSKIQKLADYFMVAKSDLVDDKNSVNINSQDFDLLMKINSDDGLKDILIEYFGSSIEQRKTSLNIIKAYYNALNDFNGSKQGE